MATQTSSTTTIFVTDSLPQSISVSRPWGTIACLIASDMLAISLSLLAGAVIRNLYVPQAEAPVVAIWLAALVLSLCSLTAAGLYPGVTVNPVEELRRSTLSVTLAFLSLATTTFFLHDLSQSRLIYALGYLFTVGLIPLLRACTRSLFSAMPWWGCGVVILGFGETGKAVLGILRKNSHIGLRVVAVLDDDPWQYGETDGVIRGPLSRCLQITRDHKLSYGILCMPGLEREELLGLIDRYGPCFSHLLVIPNLMGIASVGVSAREMGGIVGLEVTNQLLRPSSRFAKRGLDLGFTFLLAPVVVPVMAICALLIALERRGPVFYANERVGRGGRTFKAWKFRSMVVNGDAVLRRYLADNPTEGEIWAKTQKVKHDPRITRIGKVIRRASLDELPQFWNVLRGDMSVVGPSDLGGANPDVRCELWTLPAG